ncbi:hypothetical protein GmRootA79_52270 [Acidovorax sp. A79]
MAGRSFSLAPRTTGAERPAAAAARVRFGGAGGVDFKMGRGMVVEVCMTDSVASFHA